MDGQGNTVFPFTKPSGAEGPGTIAAPTETSRHITLEWNGIGSNGNPVAPDFSWVIDATASRLVAGGGGDEQVAHTTVPNASLNLEIYDSSSSTAKLISKAFYDSPEQKRILLNEASKATNLTVKLKGFRPANNTPVEISLKGQRSNREVRKTMVKQGDDYVVSFPSSELLQQPALSTSLYLHENSDTRDSDQFLRLFGPLLGTTVSYSWLGADPKAIEVLTLPVLPGPTDQFQQNRTLPTLNNIRVGGYEVVQAKFTQSQRPLEARFRQRNSTEIRYYSGHGWHGANCLWEQEDLSTKKDTEHGSNYYGGRHTVYQRVLDKTTLRVSEHFQPVELQEIATPDDFKEAKLWVVAGCSILDIFDLNGNFKYAYQFTRGWQNGEEWFNLAGGLNRVTFCGYNFEGAPDDSGTPEAVLKEIFSSLGSNVTDYSKWPRAWMDANIKVDSFDNACAIGPDGTYYYIKFDEAVVRRPERFYGGTYHIHHTGRSLRSMKYSDWAGKNYSLDTVNQKRRALRVLFSTEIKALPDISFYVENP